MKHVHMLLTWNWPPVGLPKLFMVPDEPVRTVIYNQRGGVVDELAMRPGDDVYTSIMRHRLYHADNFALPITGVWFHNSTEGYIVQAYDAGLEPVQPRKVWYGWEQFYGEG